MNKLNREQNLESNKEKGVSKKDDKHLLGEPYCCIVWRETEYDDSIERTILHDIVLEGERSAMEAECKSLYDRASEADLEGIEAKWAFDDCAKADDIRSNPTIDN